MHCGSAKQRHDSTWSSKPSAVSVFFCLRADDEEDAAVAEALAVSLGCRLEPGPSVSLDTRCNYLAVAMKLYVSQVPSHQKHNFATGRCLFKAVQEGVVRLHAPQLNRPLLAIPREAHQPRCRITSTGHHPSILKVDGTCFFSPHIVCFSMAIAVAFLSFISCKCCASSDNPAGSLG